MPTLAQHRKLVKKAQEEFDAAYALRWSIAERHFPGYARDVTTVRDLEASTARHVMAACVVVEDAYRALVAAWKKAAND